MGDTASVVPLENVAVKYSLSYDYLLVAIVDHLVRRLRNKDVALVMVFWRSQYVERATWEEEAFMKFMYPNLIH